MSGRGGQKKERKKINYKKVIEMRKNCKNYSQLWDEDKNEVKRDQEEISQA